jgi:hypothetical protein
MSGDHACWAMCWISCRNGQQFYPTEIPSPAEIPPQGEISFQFRLFYFIFLYARALDLVLV